MLRPSRAPDAPAGRAGEVGRAIRHLLHASDLPPDAVSDHDRAMRASHGCLPVSQPARRTEGGRRERGQHREPPDLWPDFSEGRLRHRARGQMAAQRPAARPDSRVRIRRVLHVGLHAEPARGRQAHRRLGGQGRRQDVALLASQHREKRRVCPDRDRRLRAGPVLRFYRRLSLPEKGQALLRVLPDGPDPFGLDADAGFAEAGRGSFQAQQGELSRQRGVRTRSWAESSTPWRRTV